MGHPQKNVSSFCNILVCVRVVNPTIELDIYIVLQTCLLLEGCPGQCASSGFQLITVGPLVQKLCHSEGWIPGIQTQRIHATGATPLEKHHHQRKMNLMSNMIKSNAIHAVMCVAC